MVTANENDRDNEDDDEIAHEEEEPKEFPPELKAVPPDEMRRVYEAAKLVALRLTKSKARADELVSDVFVKLTTTRRWNPARKPLLEHVIGALRSELNHQYASKAPERERTANEAYHRDVVPLRVESTEERMLARAKAATELSLLEARISNHDLVPKVLQCKADGIDRPADIARALGVPAARVHRAIELLKHHLANIRAASDDDGDSDEGE
jgi:DNA-directed RNA polymerase specialized sigma24 family protein